MHDKGFVVGAIGLMVVLAFCAFAVYIGFYPTPAANQHFIDISLGALVTQFANVIGYYFGSSRTAEQHLAERLKSTVQRPLDNNKQA